MTPQSQRIILAYKVLLDNNIVESSADFARKIDYHRVSWAQVLADNRELPEEYYDKLWEVFNIRPEYIKTGKGAMFALAPTIKKTVVAKKININLAKNTLEYTDKYGLDHEIIFEGVQSFNIQSLPGEKRNFGEI